MLPSSTKNMFKNIVRHTNVHNRVMEESECWSQYKKLKTRSQERERSSSPVQRSFLYDDRSDPARSEDRDRRSRQAHMDDRDSPRQTSTFYTRQLAKAEEQDPNRWGHSGFKELYPDQFDSDRSKDSDSDSDDSRYHWRKTQEKRAKKKQEEARKKEDSKRKSHKSKNEPESQSTQSSSSSEDKKKKKKKKHKKHKSQKDKSEKHRKDKHQSERFDDAYRMDQRDDRRQDRDKYRDERYGSSNSHPHRDLPSVGERGRVSNGHPRPYHEESRKHRERNDRPRSKDKHRRTRDRSSHKQRSDDRSAVDAGKRKRAWDSDISSSDEEDRDWKRTKV